MRIAWIYRMYQGIDYSIKYIRVEFVCKDDLSLHTTIYDSFPTTTNFRISLVNGSGEQTYCETLWMLRWRICYKLALMTFQCFIQVLLDRSKAADIITDIFFAAGKVNQTNCICIIVLFSKFSIRLNLLPFLLSSFVSIDWYFLARSESNKKHCFIYEYIKM